MMPRSNSSMAKAMVTPADMESRPYSSAARSAAMTASGLVTPVTPPNEYSVSYSGPSVMTPV